MSKPLATKVSTPLSENALPNPSRYFIFNFLVISLIFTENKCFSDVMWIYA